MLGRPDRQTRCAADERESPGGSIARRRRWAKSTEDARGFAGEDSTNPNHVSIIAHGNGINVHHCIFRASKISIGAGLFTKSRA